MAHARTSFSVRPWDRVAIALVLLGVTGLTYHLAFKPEVAAEATAASRTPGPYIAPEIAMSRGSGNAPSGSEELTEMRRRLREFIIPRPDIKALPVPDALALLENHWLSLPHETDQVPPASFTLDQAALKHMVGISPPMLVTLEIPGVSLLTNLNLLAAQAGLQNVVTKSGAVLGMAARSSEGGNQSATTSLSNETINHYLFRANRLMPTPEQISGLFASDSEAIELILPPDATVVDIGNGAPEKIQIQLAKPLDRRQDALEKIFHPLGLSQRGNAPGFTWSAMDGILTTSGSARNLRITTAVAAALEESAHAGVQLEFLAADWNGQKPPALPEIKTHGKRFGSVSPTLSSASKKPPPSTPAIRRLKFDRHVSTMVPAPPTRPYLVFPEPGNGVTATPRAIGARFTIDLTVTVKTPANMLLPPGAEKAADFFKRFPETVCRSGEWTRLDFPLREAEPDGPKQTLFLRASRKTLGQEE